MEPEYGLAAYHLGQVHQLLLNHDSAVKYFEKAIAIDPTDVAARTELAAVLVESGDADAGIRQLTEVLRLDSTNDEVFSMLARAYWDKSAWDRCIENADKALAINRTNAQAHLWKADAMRQQAAVEKNPARQRQLYTDAREDYREFLELTNFSSGVGAKLAFSFIGFGIASRKHADRQAAYDSLRSAGFLGLCLSEAKVGNPLRGRDYCQRAIKHAPNDPIAHFLLGNINRDIYNINYDRYAANGDIYSLRKSCGDLVAAKASYTKMISLSPDLVEAKNARNYVGQIDSVLPQLGCRN
jgi:tetratricopeptide (TPR) repeat protein